MRVLVVDDEAPARRRLIRMLAALPGIEVVGEACDGVDAREQIAALAPQLVLLDIHMPGLDGIALAASPSMPAVVFVTAHAEHAVRAFELAALDYLLKPVTAERLALAIARARAHPVAASVLAAVMPAARDPAVTPRIAAKHGGSTRLFELAEIDRLHAADKYVVLIHGGREHLLERSLAELADALAPFGFLRVHRAELVRLDAVVAVQIEDGAARAELRDGQRVPVSRRMLTELRRRLIERAR